MAESSEGKSPIIPPMPEILDIEKLSIWMKDHTIRAPKGYADMKRQDGTPFSLDEQIDAHIKQTVDIINFKRQRNDPRETYQEIEQGILRFTQPDDPTSKGK
ncbi:hypothetical protein HYW41_00135 [Candidatus Daviesbacteria bacterium]|nr:hypothetical protein [Candidatus Daviesbacteria bacterium]